MRTLITEPSIQQLVDICRTGQEIIRGLKIVNEDYLQLLRLKMGEENIKRFDGENGELVTLTQYAVRITPLESRQKQNMKIRAPSVAGV